MTSTAPKLPPEAEDHMADDHGQDDGCWNCDGDGYVYHCIEDGGCVDPEGGCDLCERRCEVCNRRTGE